MSDAIESVNDDDGSYLIVPVWIRCSDGALKRVESLAVPRIGDSLQLQKHQCAVTNVTWQHDPCDDGSLCLRPVLTVEPPPESLESMGP